jgi:hypothetical protein
MRRIVRLSLVTVASAFAVTSEARAHEGWGIVRRADGSIVVTDIPANTVWRIATDGRIERVMRDTHSHALVIGADGAVYGTNVHLTQPIRSVWRMDVSGAVSTVIPPTRGMPLDLQAFLISNDGTIYSATPHESQLPPEQRSVFVVRRTPGGVIDTIAGGLRGHLDGKGRSAKFASIDGMAWLPDSSLLLVDGPHLRKLTKDGTAETLTPPLTEFRWDQDVMGVSVGANGVAYIADFAASRVLAVNDRKVAEIASTGSYWSPTGVLSAREGVYTLEHPRAPLGILGDLGIGPYLRVRLLLPNGSTETLATIWGRRTIAAVAVLAALLLLILFARAWYSRKAKARGAYSRLGRA